MNKKLFTTVVNELQKRHKDELLISGITRGYDYTDVNLTGLSSEVIMLLEDAMKDQDFWITHWLYEHKIEEPFYFLDDEPFYIRTSEELYDFLVENYKLN